MEVFPAKLDQAAWTNSYGVDIQVAGAAVQGATSVTIVAAQAPLPSVQPVSSLHQRLLPVGQAILFDPPNGKVAILSAPLYQGDTTISVQPLPTALAGTEDAKVSIYGNILVSDGLLAGRNWNGVDGDVSALFAPALNPDAFAECYLIQFPVVNLYQNNDVEFVRSFRAITVKKNYLPNYALMVADTGIVDPIVAPTLAAAGSDGTFTAGDYYGGYSYGNAFGETKISPLTKVTVGAANHVAFTSPGAFPTNAIYIKLYLSPAPLVIGVQLVGVRGTAGAFNALLPGSGAGPRTTTNTTKSGLGRQLDYINKAYKTIIGRD